LKVIFKIPETSSNNVNLFLQQFIIPNLMSIEFALPKNHNSIIKVIGVGGGGGNAVNTMFIKGISGVEFCICNTDVKALDKSPVPNKVRLGQHITEGLGAGADPQIGRQAAEESLEEIRELLKHNTKMVFITAGMGGGTGTGAAPVIARLAREMDILTVGIVTTPFSFEGSRRMKKAMEGIEGIRDAVDTLLVINNENLLQLFDEDATQSQAFDAADRVLCDAAKGIAEIIHEVGEIGGINVDFADVKRVMKNGGTALMGSATFSGNERARKAAEEALASPLLDNINIRGSKGILVNITANKDNLRMSETRTIMQFVQEMAGDDAEVIMGTVYDQGMGDSINVTIIATGFEDRKRSIETPTEILPARETGYTTMSNTPPPLPDMIIEVSPGVAGSSPRLTLEPEEQPELFGDSSLAIEEKAENKQSIIERIRLMGNDQRSNAHDPETRRRLEDEPAIDRQKGGYHTPDMPADRKLSRFSIDMDPRGGMSMHEYNSFLHGNVD
jgi:cell division protein FtsZ